MGNQARLESKLSPPPIMTLTSIQNLRYAVLWERGAQCKNITKLTTEGKSLLISKLLDEKSNLIYPMDFCHTVESVLVKLR